MMSARDKVARYVKRNPSATVREVQKACKLSSPSHAYYHLERVDTPSTELCSTCNGKGRVRRDK